MKPIHLQTTSERGQSLVLVALMMVGLLAFVGLALDGGQVFEMRRQVQNAADAGALAGVNEVATGQNALVYYRIYQYTIGNANVGNRATMFNAEYFDSSGTRYSGKVPIAPGVPPPLGTDCITVTAQRKFNTLIISFLGFNDMTVSASATGCFGQTPHLTTPIWPMAAYNQGFTKYATYTLYGDGKAQAGRFTWLSFDGSNAQVDLWTKLQSGGYRGPFQVYNTDPCDGSGQANIASVNSANCFKGLPAAASDQQAAEKQLGQIVVIGIYDSAQVNGSNSFYHVIGFGAFKIVGVCLQGTGAGDCSGSLGKNIKGQFVDKVVTGQGVCNPYVQDCGPDWGLKIIKLKN